MVIILKFYPVIQEIKKEGSKNAQLTITIKQKSFNIAKRIISVIVGDVHLVSRCEIFHESLSAFHSKSLDTIRAVLESKERAKLQPNKLFLAKTK